MKVSITLDELEFNCGEIIGTWDDPITLTFEMSETQYNELQLSYPEGTDCRITKIEIIK